MADIVKRLREYNSIPAVGSKLRIGKAIADAADEIERLREENTYLQQIIKEYQRAMGFDEECSIALGGKE